jgi:hypothetical protein
MGSTRGVIEKRINFSSEFSHPQSKWTESDILKFATKIEEISGEKSPIIISNIIRYVYKMNLIADKYLKIMRNQK